MSSQRSKTQKAGLVARHPSQDVRCAGCFAVTEPGFQIHTPLVSLGVQSQTGQRGSGTTLYALRNQ